MLEKWKKYQANEVLSGNDENGNRLISLFAKDYRSIMHNDICPSCDDFKTKYQNFIKKLETMSKVENKNSGFVLKPMYDNITLHGSNVYFRNGTLTDEQAMELLENHPKGEDLFEMIPQNLKDFKKSEKGDVVTLFGKDLTVEKAKDLFKQAGIESKANTVKGLEDKFEKLSEAQKEALSILVNPVNSADLEDKFEKRVDSLTALGFVRVDDNF